MIAITHFGRKKKIFHGDTLHCAAPEGRRISCCRGRPDPGDGHRISASYARKTLINGAVFWFAVALLSFIACGPKLLQRVLLWASEGLTKDASSEDPKFRVSSSGMAGRPTGYECAPLLAMDRCSDGLGHCPILVRALMLKAAPTYRVCTCVSEICTYVHVRENITY